MFALIMKKGTLRYLLNYQNSLPKEKGYEAEGCYGMSHNGNL